MEKQKIKIVVENTFIHSDAPQTSHGISVYERVFSKLVNEGKSLGKVHPIYLTIDSKQRILGILTLNKGGTTSLFLELPGEIQFDHITFVKDLIKNNHHFTKVTTQGRERVLPLNAELLSNGIYHAFTVFVGDPKFLKEASKKVFYPEVDIKHVPRLEDAFLASGTTYGSSIMQIGTGEGLLCIQVFLIPKDVDYRVMNFFLRPLETYIPNLDLNLENGSSEFNLIIPHEYQDDYVIGFKTIFLKKHTNKQLLAISSSLPNAHYSKIDIEWQKSKSE
ncbi:MAG: hypothetical protein KBC48_00175 [Candidatus Pacebacteria bacterium]|nr:hypothetical protein [Candidatus Paceibacterota bacterium]